MVSFYGMKFDDVLALPVRAFWSASRHVDRLRAESDLRALNVSLCAAATAQGGNDDFHRELREGLMEQMGTVMMEKKPPSPKADILALMESSRG